MSMRVPIARPWFDEADLNSIRTPLETGWVVQGPRVRAFEQKFSRFVGADDGVACSSGTSAIHLSLSALKIGPGDEVIVPSFTWIATANAVLYCGATPILCDIDLDTYNIDPAAFEAAIGPRTRAVIPVHLFGQAAPMDAVMAIATEHGLGVVEDAACAFGARWGNVHLGTIGDFGTFSFHPRKAITTGEGGMVVCRNPGDMDRLRSLRDHGAERTESGMPRFDRLGFNYRMTDIQGALGYSQMDKANWIIEQRAERARRYDRLLAEFDWIRTPSVVAGSVHAYQAYVCLFRPEKPSLANLGALNTLRNVLMTNLEDRGVSTRQGTHAVHALGLYRERYGYQETSLEQSWLADQLTFALPLYPQMTDAEQDYVVEHLAGCWNELTTGD
jgi:dTDP-4-amino-4,6-dideoxygalactose transaminase